MLHLLNNTSAAVKLAMPRTLIPFCGASSVHSDEAVCNCSRLLVDRPSNDAMRRLHGCAGCAAFTCGRGRTPTTGRALRMEVMLNDAIVCFVRVEVAVAEKKHKRKGPGATQQLKSAAANQLW